MSVGRVTYSKDYQAPFYVIDKTNLVFELQDETTRVTSTLHIRKAVATEAQLKLDGQSLTLISVKLNGRLIERDEFELDEDSLTLHALPDTPFVLECVTDIHPEKNLALEGLYRSRGMYCTQCEAEGFRRITYYLDRPDVLSEYETTIIAPEGKFPVMLSNGNCVADSVDQGMRTVTWHDPFKKPCYLFALVAGDLAVVEDTYTTCTNRIITLQIFVEEKDLDKCDHAMQSLKAAMTWDEEVYGREYDLDIFMIVAVDDFNMGAMENKGLNIFNTSCVLANPKTTTDAGFQRVEAVVAHEYFHNWSGNRVTCRDWFQLSLKEGFTVYRDSEFSADMNSRAVKRIEDATLMRTHQFVEDSGPMSHAVRPDAFMEISNFYTLTVYEKGAEVVRMMANLLGKEKFRQATDLYFDRFDGMAVTCEDFVVCMEEVSGLDLSQFRLWYSQAGTPELRVSEAYDQEKQQYRLDIEQSTPDTANQTNKQPMHIPFDIALLSGEEALLLDNGKREKNLQLKEAKSSFVFENVADKPTPVLLRYFSAPVKVFFDYSDKQLAQIVAVESDGFSQFSAIQQLYTNQIQKIMVGEHIDESSLYGCLNALLSNTKLDPAVIAKLLVLPAESYLIELQEKANPLAVYEARNQLQKHIAETLFDRFQRVYDNMHQQAQDVSGKAMAARSLKNGALSYLMRLGCEDVQAQAFMQFNKAQNMTDESSALRAIVHYSQDTAQVEQVTDAFYETWQHEALVVNMWLQIQAQAPRTDALARVKMLMGHPSYQAKNPNKIRALVGGFCMGNTSGFHDVSGEGYAFLANQVLSIDATNPQIASRLVTPLTGYKKYSDAHAEKMKAELLKMREAKLSNDLYEVIHKSL